MRPFQYEGGIFRFVESKKAQVDENSEFLMNQQTLTVIITFRLFLAILRFLPLFLCCSSPLIYRPFSSFFTAAAAAATEKRDLHKFNQLHSRLLIIEDQGKVAHIF
jgi:hypothetical protein